ncbi:YMGG-like glycine zipper-containing protein [Mesorhizobium sp. B1-1-1]|uniref:YMGG-like glycine zipper-containing protein n=2 Tax=unclassified Mesorhizobium TaxID=325217 RepID=UPI0032B17ADB
MYPGDETMRSIIFVSALALMAAGCTATEQRTAGTALAGAGTGAVIGGLANGSRGALVGAAVGGGTGAVVGAATAPRAHHRECWVRDRWGHTVRDRQGRPITKRC